MFEDWWAIPKLAYSSRSPMSWFWGALWIVCYPFLAVLIGILGTVFGLVQFAGFWHLSRVGHNARTSDVGVEVFSRQKGHIATYAWASISQLRLIFEPPLTYWEIVLTNGEEVPLPVADLEVEAFRDRGIPVHEQRKFRSDYS